MPVQAHNPRTRVRWFFPRRPLGLQLGVEALDVIAKAFESFVHFSAAGCDARVRGFAGLFDGINCSLRPLVQFVA